MSDRRLTADRRRALTVLAGAPDGMTEATLLAAHGFTVELLADLVAAGLASTTVEQVRAGRRSLRVTRVRITETGRRALAGITK